MYDLLVVGGKLPNGEVADIAIRNGRIAAVEKRISGEASETIDVSGFLLSPPFVDPHFHMDATLSYGNRESTSPERYWKESLFGTNSRKS